MVHAKVTYRQVPLYLCNHLYASACLLLYTYILVHIAILFLKHAHIPNYNIYTFELVVGGISCY